MQKTVIILSIFALIASSCGQTVRKQTETENDIQVVQDTLIVKHKYILNESARYSKSYSYYWLVGKDTLDFRLRITERKSDSTIDLCLSHREPILFTEALRRIESCLPLITEDFELSKLASFYLYEPIYYLDLATELSKEYEQEFGRKDVEYRKLDEFLLKSSLTTQLNHFFNPLNKKVKQYGWEKFRLVNKEDYNKDWYWPNLDLTEYPEFTLYSYTGVFVWLENK